MTITHRIKLVPDFTFEEWVVKHPEIKGKMRLKGKEYIDAIAIEVMGTRLRKVMDIQEMRRKYLEDLTYTKVEVPLDLSNADDLAYFRMMEKREKKENDNNNP